MKSLPIKELITEIITGEWGIDAIKDKGVAVIRTANFLNSGQIDFSKIVRREIDEKKVSKKKLFSGDIIIEKSGGSLIQPVGRVVLFKNPDKDTYLCNNFTSVLRPNRDIVFSEYLFYALHYNHKKGKTLRYQNKTTGIINLKLDKYLSSEIHIPPLDDQIRIATLLSKVESLISRRREQLKKLDELLKSIFLEMFGDPVRNEKGWEMKRMDEISDSRLGKMRDKKFITGNHLRKYIGNSNVQWFRFKLDDLEEMDFDERERTLFGLKNGDLLICEGGDIGRCAIWRNNLTECYFQKAIHRVRLYHSQAIPEYVQYVMMFFSLYNGFKNVACKATIAHLTGEKLKKTLIPLPPLELQNQFANIEEKIISIKSYYQKSLTVQENLYEVLSQKAFKGELDLSRVQLVEEGDLVI